MSEKRKFKVGDKVRVKRFEERPEHWCDFGKMDCLMGKVVEINYIDEGSLPYRINHKGESWWLKDSDIEPQKKECIVIYRKGQEVIALDKATGNKAIAKCSPEDEFVFNIGSKLAFERLLGIEEQKEAKPKFLKKFEEGKIYVFRKELHAKDIPRHANTRWACKCDGKVVNVIGLLDGEIDNFGIVPEWCEEIGYKKDGADNE